ncbi:nucleoside 2-deoxyribosyltransferase-like protein [Rhizobium azibense]|nr:nucleoside 2-deoxyribosyltransferase-like protein [Rhizobium azibense]
MRIYLVGPLTGRPKAWIADWRTQIKSAIGEADFIDPTSWDIDTKEAFAVKERSAEALHRRDHGRLVVDRNKLLIKSADVVFANLLGAGAKASIGSVGELFLANGFGKPVIVVREKLGNVHDHAMLNAIASRICYTLEEGFGVLQEFAVPRVA